MWSYLQIILTKHDKSATVEDRVGGYVMDSQLVMGEYLAKEITARRCEAAEEVLPEDDDLVGGMRRRDLITSGSLLDVAGDEARGVSYLTYDTLLSLQ